MEQVAGTVDQPRNFLLAEHGRQSLEPLWVGQILLHIPALQNLTVEEPKRGNLDDDCAVRQFPVFEQIHLLAAKIVRSEVIEPLLYVLAKRFHRVQIRTDRCFRIGAAHEFLAHPLQKYGHRELLSLQSTLLVQTSEMLFRPPRQRLRSCPVVSAQPRLWPRRTRKLCM